MYISRLPRVLQRNSISIVRKESTRAIPKDGLGLEYFIHQSKAKDRKSSNLNIPYTGIDGQNLRFFVETYGCQMNLSDTEIVNSVLISAGHTKVDNIDNADLILTNTCAVRENAETKVWNRLKYFQSLRKKNYSKKTSQRKFPMVGVLGCMAERLKEKLLLEDSVDFVCGPDTYREIPKIVNSVFTQSEKVANTLLSLEETYSDINPIREHNKTTAFVSIMRGCNNMCSFCIVPFTRGRERSRPFTSILQEIQTLSNNGIKDITLLGQNVNGYHDTSEESVKLFPETHYESTPGFKNLYNSKKRNIPGARFYDLLKAVSEINPEMRIRFTSPHPKDFPLPVIELIAEKINLCKSIHLPLQSGSNSVLQRMRRGYTIESYLELVDRMRKTIPNVSISTDLITGFCNESEAEHLDTIRAMDLIKFDQCFMYAYSLREKTHASYTMEDNISEEIKKIRLQQIIDSYHKNLNLRNQNEINSLRLVLIEEEATKSTIENKKFTGKTDENKRVVFKANEKNVVNFEKLENFNEKQNIVEAVKRNNSSDVDGVGKYCENYDIGDYMLVRIDEAKLGTLYGTPLIKMTNQEFYQYMKK